MDLDGDWLAQHTLAVHKCQFGTAEAAVLTTDWPIITADIAERTTVEPSPSVTKPGAGLANQVPTGSIQATCALPSQTPSSRCQDVIVKLPRLTSAIRLVWGW
jgi:hypothetical protein